MEIKYWPERSGKTTALIKECAEKGGYIVCHSFTQASILADIAKKLDLSINFPMTFSEYIRGDFNPKGVEKVYIDDIDLCLRTISKVPIVAMTLRMETVRVPKELRKPHWFEDTSWVKDELKKFKKGL